MRRPLLLSVLAAVLVLAGCGAADEAAAPAAPAPSSPAASATPSEDPSGPAEGPVGQTYLALGDSLAAGYQPGGTELRDSAYPALALSRLDRAGADLTLENLACSGETTDSFLDGGKCDYAAGSQMAQAEAILAERAGDVALVSIDLGGNDLLRCVRERSVDTACTKQGLAGVAENLPEILDRLRAAAGQDVPLLVLGYYNPWLAASYLGEGEGQLDAATSAYTALDRAITKAATEADATPVPLTSAFKLDDATPTTFGGREVPTNVAQVCTLTYICTAFDIHLTDEGAAVVGRVVAAAATKAGVT